MMRWLPQVLAASLFAFLGVFPTSGQDVDMATAGVLFPYDPILEEAFTSGVQAWDRAAYDSAFASFQAVISAPENRRTTAAMLMAGRTLLVSERYGEAVGLLSSFVKRYPESRYAEPASATLELAEPKREAFNAVRLKAPLADSLKLKKSLMESALSAYNDAAGYEIADVTTVATFRIAELYQQLSIDLFASERPQGLSDEELEQYDILLEEQAFPFEEKAIELYEVNASRSASGVYDEWVASSFEQLAILMPARYAKFEKAEIYVAELR